MSHTYKMRYKMEPWTGTAEEARAQAADGWGACDALFYASILYPEDGSLSVLLAGKDGRTSDVLADGEWFKVWTMLANRLAKSATLPEAQREFCRVVWDTFCESLRLMRVDEDAKEAPPRRDANPRRTSHEHARAHVPRRRRRRKP